MIKQAILFSTLLFNVACSSDDDKDDVNAGTYSVGGTITAMSGELTLAINGVLETINVNGNFVAETRIEKDAAFNVSIVESTDNLSCSISNETGTSSTDVTNIEIVCNGTDFSAYDLNALAFQEDSPSVLTFAFHLVDRFTGEAVDTITKDNITDFLKVEENDAAVSPRESFLEVDKLGNYNAEYHTVFVIDVSSSLFSEELLAIKSAIKNVIADEVSGESKLLSNQSVTILTFDGEVDVVIENSRDPNAIIEQLEMITVGGNSTNLYGAIKQGAEVWENEISLDLLSYGSLILFTDGVHNSDDSSTASALNAAQGKDLYFIAIGDETDTTALKEFTSSDNIYPLADFEQLDSVLQTTFSKIKTFEDGLYVMSYATPKRSGSHTLKVEAIDDYPCDVAVNEREQASIDSNGKVADCADTYSSSFDATGFTDIVPVLTLTGAKTTLVPEVLWQAKLRWSRETPSYTWTIRSCHGDLSYTFSDDDSAVTFTRNDPDYAIAYVQLTEDSTGGMSESYLVMANNQGTINDPSQMNRFYLENICGN